MRKFSRVIWPFALIAAVVLSAPFWVRLGSTKEIRKWHAPRGHYGFDRLWVSVTRDVGYVDIFSGYSSYRLIVTDGGYVYARSFDVPYYDSSNYLARCNVRWQTDGLEFLDPDGLKLFIPSESLIQQIGRR